VSRYAETRNFTVLHMVTGLRALRMLSPWIEDPAAVAPVLARAVTAAYLAARVPANPELPPVPSSDWGGVIHAAIASSDDHVIKIVHACRDEAAAYGEGRYLEAAALAVA